MGTVAADPLAMAHAHIKIRFFIILILGGLWHQTRGKSLLVKTEDESAGYKQLDIKHGGQGGDYVDYDMYINKNTKCPMISGPWKGRDCQYTFQKSKFCTTKDARAACNQEQKFRKDEQCQELSVCCLLLGIAGSYKSLIVIRGLLIMAKIYMLFTIFNQNILENHLVIKIKVC